MRRNERWFAMSATLFTICALLAPATLGAQTRGGSLAGTVRSVAAEPIAGARIELWSLTARIKVAVSDVRGDFRFDSVDVSGGHSAVAYAVGFHATTVVLGSTSDPMHIVLKPHIYDLPAIHVVPETTRCARQSERDAIALFDEMRSRYTQPAPDAQVGGGFYVYHSTVALSQLGKFDERSSPFAVRTSLPVGQKMSLVGDGGFATPLAAGASLNDAGNWKYADLGGTEAYLFLTDEFKTSHTFAILSSDSTETVLSFCPVQKRKPSLQGVLRLGKDMMLLSASWKFVVPRADEGATGEVLFAPIGDRKGYLTPLSSTFATAGRGLGYYRQRLERYAAWAVGSREDMRALVKSWFADYNNGSH